MHQNKADHDLMLPHSSWKQAWQSAIGLIHISTALWIILNASSTWEKNINSDTYQFEKQSINKYLSELIELK